MRAHQDTQRVSLQYSTHEVFYCLIYVSFSISKTLFKFLTCSSCSKWCFDQQLTGLLVDPIPFFFRYNQGAIYFLFVLTDTSTYNITFCSQPFQCIMFDVVRIVLFLLQPEVEKCI